MYRVLLYQEQENLMVSSWVFFRQEEDNSLVCKEDACGKLTSRQWILKSFLNPWAYFFLILIWMIGKKIWVSKSEKHGFDMNVSLKMNTWILLAIFSSSWSLLNDWQNLYSNVSLKDQTFRCSTSLTIDGENADPIRI